MLVDTGATGMTVSESIADSLIANGQATEAAAEMVGLAGGVKREFRQVDISSVTVGGHVVTNVHAGVVPDGSDMLLGLGVLAKVSGKFAINVANSTLDFD
jgi:predicted aspartyl protease